MNYLGVVLGPELPRTDISLALAKGGARLPASTGMKQVNTVSTLSLLSVDKHNGPDMVLTVRSQKLRRNLRDFQKRTV